MRVRAPPLAASRNNLGNSPLLYATQPITAYSGGGLRLGSTGRRLRRRAVLPAQRRGLALHRHAQPVRNVAPKPLPNRFSSAGVESFAVTMGSSSRLHQQCIIPHPAWTIFPNLRIGRGSLCSCGDAASPGVVPLTSRVDGRGVRFGADTMADISSFRY